MRFSAVSARLDKLPQNIPALWRGRDGDNSKAGIETGFAALDAALPGGGWPAGALTEILCEPQASGALRLLMPALARVHGDGRWQAWIAPPYLPYAPALAAVGIDLAATMLIHKPQAADALWAAEQLLRSGLCNAVLLWPNTADFRALRRLQLAAEQGDCRGWCSVAWRTPSNRHRRLCACDCTRWTTELKCKS